MRCASASAAAATTASRASAAGRCSTSGTVLLEVFLFDFAGDLYGQTIDVAFIDWIRPELEFPGVEELVRRMDEDARLARAALARRPDAFPPLDGDRVAPPASGVEPYFDDSRSIPVAKCGA